MNLVRKIFSSNFFIKLRNWEFWPFGVVHAPIFLYWLWLSLKARSLFFFSASNPSILTGGMMGESKFDVLKLVPDEHKPITFLVKIPAVPQDIIEKMNHHGIKLPAVFKPDLGERGWMVRIIQNYSEISQYLNDIKIDFMVQAFAQEPLEFGVYYVRKPNEEKGKVVSITGKEMLTVTGNGKNTLKELVMKKARAKLQASWLKLKFSDLWDTIIPNNKSIVLNQIGNHCLGTKFLNHNHLITEKLNDSFDRLSKRIDGFFFGRYDLRCNTLEELENGKVMIVELNGCGAEPSHIYHPGFSLWKALRVLFRHLKDMYEVSYQNHNRGIPYLSFSEAKLIYKRVTTTMGK